MNVLKQEKQMLAADSEGRGKRSRKEEQNEDR